MTVSDTVRARVREHAQYQCGYCRVEEQYIYAPIEVDHIYPQSEGESDDEENLWLACPRCNGFKGAQIYGVDPATRQRIQLFNPRKQKWSDHFRWGEDHAEIIGITDCGRATVEALQLNFAPNLELRRLFVKAGWYPPEE
jgi:HNH endonuclease